MNYIIQQGLYISQYQMDRCNNLPYVHLLCRIRTHGTCLCGTYGNQVKSYLVHALLLINATVRIVHEDSYLFYYSTSRQTYIWASFIHLFSFLK